MNTSPAWGMTTICDLLSNTWKKHTRPLCSGFRLVGMTFQQKPWLRGLKSARCQMIWMKGRKNMKQNILCVTCWQSTV